MPRRVIEALLVGDNTHVRQAAEENQSAELELFFLWRRRKCRPIRTCRAALEIHAHVLKSSPHKAGAIERIRTSPVEVIARSQVLLDCRHQFRVQSSQRTLAG